MKSQVLILLVALAGDQLQAAPINFVPFPVKDLKTNKEIPGNSPVKLPNGKTITAAQFYEAINKVEKDLNAKGLSVRNPKPFPKRITRTIDPKIIKQIELANIPTRPTIGTNYQPNGQIRPFEGMNCAGRVDGPFQRYNGVNGDNVFKAQVQSHSLLFADCSLVRAEAQTSLTSVNFVMISDIYRHNMKLEGKSSGTWSLQNEFLIDGKVVNNDRSSGNGEEPASASSAIPSPFSVKDEADFAVLSDTLGVVVKYNVTGSVQLNRDLRAGRSRASVKLNPKISSAVLAEGHTGLVIAAAGIVSTLQVANGTLQRHTGGEVLQDQKKTFLRYENKSGVDIELLKGKMDGWLAIALPSLGDWPPYQVLRTEFDITSWEGLKLKRALEGHSGDAEFR